MTVTVRREKAFEIPSPRDKPERKIEKQPQRKRIRRRRLASTTREKPLSKKKDVRPDLPPGKLRLVTNPWTDIYCQSRKIGQNPLVDVELPAGRIKLRPVKKNAGIDNTVYMQIRSGERAVERFNLF